MIAFNDYIATFRIDGEDWPFSGTAVTTTHSVKAEFRPLVTGDPLRVVTVDPRTPSRAIKRQQIQVTFQLIGLDWLKRLQNLMDANQAFPIRLLAFDSRLDEGVPLHSTAPVLTTIAPPRLSNDAAFTQVTTTGGTLVPSLYTYRVSARIGTSETPLSPSLDVVVGMGLDTITLGWRHIAGATSYKIYGRQDGILAYMGTVTPTAGTAAGTMIAFVDNGAVTPGADATSPLTEFAAAAERRWADDPTLLTVIKNSQVITNYTLIDLNGNTLQSGSTCTVYAAEGRVVFATPLLPTDTVRMVYVWEPLVQIDEIAPNAEPTAAQVSSFGIPPSSVGTSYGVLYSPTLTLWEVK